MSPAARSAWPAGPVTVLGAINWDVSVFEERFPRPGEEVPVRAVEEFSGGKGANAAVAAARILGRGRAALVGGLGTDDIARKQVKELRREGVDTAGVLTIDGCRSGRAYVLVDGEGRKTIHTHFGANESLRPAHLKMMGPARVLARTRTLVAMDSPTEVAVEAARVVKGRAAVIYSPGVRSRERGPGTAAMLRLADLLVVDEVELENLGGAGDPEAAARRLLRGGRPSSVIATLGERGCLVVGPGESTHIEGVRTSALGLRTVNTTGCGDAFLGVLASYLACGAPLQGAAKLANLAGAWKATRQETRGSPSKSELESAARKVRQTRPG